MASLEPFLLISKSAKGAAAAKLIHDATSAPGVFVYAELLELPNIQEVRPLIASHFRSTTYNAEISLPLASSMPRSSLSCSSSRTAHSRTT